MRVLFVHSGADLYGASRSLLRLSSRLARDGHAVLAILPYEGPLVEELKRSGVQVRVHTNLPVVTRGQYTRWRRLFSLIVRVPGSIFSLRSEVKRFRPQVMHSNTALILTSGIVSRLCRIPHVWHVREFFNEFKLLWKLYQWFMYLFADRIICVSVSVADQFAARIRRRKVAVIHNGFPRDEFEPVGADRIQDLKKEFGLVDCELVGVIGRIRCGRKGQDVFVRAVSLLKDKFLGVRYLLIGSPFPGNEEHLENLRRLMTELKVADRIIYTGDIKDIKAAYAALDVSVVPSALPEPFAGVTIESMAFGKPVVGTRTGGTIEQIEDGVTGYLVEPNDPHDLAEAIEKLLISPELRRTMGYSGRARFLSSFEFEPFYLNMISLYTETITGQRQS